MPWKYKELADTLSGLYYRSNDIVSLIIKAGLKPQYFVLDGSSANVIWTLVLREVENRAKMLDVVKVAIEDHPDIPVLQDFAFKDFTDLKSVYDGEELNWKGGTNKTSYLEKITGNQSTLLDIVFLEIGLIKSQPIARIVTPSGLGTGFLITDSDLLLTNHHVIDKPPVNGEYTAQFNYQKTSKGKDDQFEEFQIDDSVFHTSVEDDWTVVKVKGNPSAEKKYKYLPLKEVSTKKDDFVNIIQHPGGGPKQIGLYHNLVTFANDSRVQYLTDTLPGSSGSPVFNSSWDVVALHHSGGWLEEPGQNGPPVLRNEGININRIKNSPELKGYFN